MAVAAVTMAMEAVNGAAETALDRAAIGPSARARHGLVAGSAGPSPREAHRDGADCRSPHQCQDDAARAFHEAIPLNPTQSLADE